jgi:hypothetical protein
MNRNFDIVNESTPDHPIQYDENGNVVIQPMKDVPE